MPGQTCTVPEAITWPAIHCMSWPMEKTKPSRLCRKPGVQGSRSASASTGSALRSARMVRSAPRSAAERRLAPMGSSR
ncbi:MAG: hypothetical protein QM767_24390 [Anaeromyxobacter sp.]